MNQRNWPSQDQVSATNKNMDPLDINGADFVRVMNSLEVNPAEITLGSQLGKGAFGEVYLGSLIRQGTTCDVAVKAIKGQCSAEEHRKSTEEAKLFALLQHPNIVKCVGVHLTAMPMYIILELMLCDLKTYLLKHPPSQRHS